jgi:large subunit ribosomal protein L30e
LSLNQPIASAVSTGDCRIGAKSSMNAIRTGIAKLVVVAANCPKEDYEDIVHFAKLTGTKIHKFEGSSWDLGEVAGKPFMVSAIAVIKPGDSNILKLV